MSGPLHQAAVRPRSSDDRLAGAAVEDRASARCSTWSRRTVCRWCGRSLQISRRHLTRSSPSHSRPATAKRRSRWFWSGWVIATGLSDPIRVPLDSARGILCEVVFGEITRLPLACWGREPNDPNYQLIEDYWHWFWMPTSAPDTWRKPRTDRGWLVPPMIARPSAKTVNWYPSTFSRSGNGLARSVSRCLAAWRPVVQGNVAGWRADAAFRPQSTAERVPCLPDSQENSRRLQQGQSARSRSEPSRASATGSPRDRPRSGRGWRRRVAAEDLQGLHGLDRGDQARDRREDSRRIAGGVVPGGGQSCIGRRRQAVSPGRMVIVCPSAPGSRRRPKRCRA